MENIKFYIQAGEGHTFMINGKSLKHGDEPYEIEVKSEIKNGNTISFQIPDSEAHAEIGTDSLTSVTITKSEGNTFVLGNYSENKIRIANCCAYNPRCGLTVCGYQAWANCGDGSSVCC